MTRKIENALNGCKLAPSLCLACVLFLVFPGSSEAQVHSASQEEMVKIALKDDFRLTLRFNAYPAYAFHLWLPELAIFDSDLDRSQAADPIDGVWLARRQGYLQVTGRLTAGDKRMDVKCTLRPLSTSSIMLALEVRNSGTRDWSDQAQLAVCLAPAENNAAFFDTSGNRTYINPQQTGISSITQAGFVGDFNHYAVSERNDPADSVLRCHVRDGFVARESPNGRISISFMWEKAARVDVNPRGLDCIHSHPAVGSLKPGDSKTLNGYIMIREGSPRNHYPMMKELIAKYHEK